MAAARHILLAIVMTLLLFGTGVFVFATPVPVFCLFAIYGRKTGWLSLLIVSSVAVVVSLFKLLGTDVLSLPYFGCFMLISVLLGEGILRKWNLIKLSCISIFVPSLLIITAFFVSQFVLHFNLIGQIHLYMSQMFDQVLKMKELPSTVSAPQLAYFKEHLNEIIDMGIRTMPSGICLFMILTVSLSLLSGRIFARKSGSFAYLGNISSIQFPFWIVWATLTSGAIYFIDAYFVHDIYLKFAAVNLLILSVSAYFIQGCLIIAFWLQKKKSPLFRIAVYGLIIAFLQFVGFFIIAIGLSDQWLDYRKKLRLNT